MDIVPKLEQQKTIILRLSVLIIPRFYTGDFETETEKQQTHKSAVERVTQSHMSANSSGNTFEQTPASCKITTMQACRTCIYQKKRKRAAFCRFSYPNCMVFLCKTDE